MRLRKPCFLNRFLTLGCQVLLGMTFTFRHTNKGWKDQPSYSKIADHYRKAPILRQIMQVL